MADEDVDGPWLSPLFFLSYPRAPRLGPPAPPSDGDGHVRRFYTDLCTNVAALVGPPVGIDTGFIDRGMDAGQEWEPELFDALDTCQSFVALISPGFRRSDYCLREWDRFAERKVLPRDDRPADHQRAIVPVTWVPIATKRLPPRLRTIERFSPEGLPDPRMAAMYRDYGVWGLLQTNHEDVYLNVVWMVARRVAEICTDYRVEPREGA